MPGIFKRGDCCSFVSTHDMRFANASSTPIERPADAVLLTSCCRNHRVGSCLLLHAWCVRHSSRRGSAIIEPMAGQPEFHGIPSRRGARFYYGTRRRIRPSGCGSDAWRRPCIQRRTGPLRRLSAAIRTGEEGRCISTADGRRRAGCRVAVDATPGDITRLAGRAARGAGSCRRWSWAVRCGIRRISAACSR